VLEIIHRRFYEGRPERMVELEEARATAAIARRVYDLREKSGLSRRALARIAGVSEHLIRRLEEDDYEREPIEELQNVAHALGHRVDIRILPDRRTRRSD
jgi:transcriptional regulator with XRE-family HTH domain